MMTKLLLVMLTTILLKPSLKQQPPQGTASSNSSPQHLHLNPTIHLDTSLHLPSIIPFQPTPTPSPDEPFAPCVPCPEPVLKSSTMPLSSLDTSPDSPSRFGTQEHP